MSIAFVRSEQVVTVNAENFQWPNQPNGVAKQIPCQNVEIVNSFWKIPTTLGNRVTGYNVIVANTSTKPTADSLKVLRVKDTRDNTEYEFAIVDTDNIGTSSPPNQFAYLCDGLGGTLPVMPTVVIPAPIMQSKPNNPANNTTGTNHFVFAFPANPLGLLYSIPFPWFNSVGPTTPYVPSGITTAALFVTWANSNWSTYGTWTSSGDIVTLASPVGAGIYVLLAGMQVYLTAVHYCVTLNASPDIIDGVKISNAFFKLPGGAISAGRTNIPAVIQAIKPLFPNAVITNNITNKIDILTTQLPQALSYQGVAVAGLNFTSGACS